MTKTTLDQNRLYAKQRREYFRSIGATASGFLPIPKRKKLITTNQKEERNTHEKQSHHSTTITEREEYDQWD